LVLYAFESEADRDYSEWVSLRVLWTVIDINVRWLLEHPGTTSLYASRLRYNGQAYQLGQEDWMDLPSAYRTCKEPDKCGVGTDCKVLVAIRVAELRAHGENARPYLVRQRQFIKADGSPSWGYHVIVQRGDGSFEDPSTILGMPSKTTF
jgi:hypothetical protein